MLAQMCNFSVIILGDMLVLVQAFLRTNHCWVHSHFPHFTLFNMVSSIGHSSSSYDLWIILNPSEVEYFGASIPLSQVEFLYVTIKSVGALTNPNLGLPWDVEPGQEPCFSLPVQLNHLLPHLVKVLILVIMCLKGRKRGVDEGNIDKWENHQALVIMLMDCHYPLVIMLETSCQPFQVMLVGSDQPLSIMLERNI